jgi:serine/threonine-protein kinase
MPEAPFTHFGKYEIQAELGRGGFGRVFRAFDPTVGRLVAIKILMSDGGADLLTRFRNEAMATGKLRHENIVTIYEFGEDRGTPFIAMEYLEGEDLQQVLASGKPLTLLEKLSMMTQAAAGLDCAHRHGVVHRDVKPANIRLLPDGRVKIMDFGIARLIREAGGARLTRQGHVLGTLLYMAPEQVMGSDSDALCDIFAYGVTFYELLTGRHPFQAQDPRSVFYKITSEDPEPVHHVAPDCPETLDPVIRRALHKDRELRYQSLHDLRVDVEPVLMELRRERAAALVTQASGCIAERNFDAARPLLNEAIELDPVNAPARRLRDTVQGELRRRLLRPRVEALLAKADQSLKAGHYSDAVETLDAAMRLDPEDASLQSRSRQAQQQREQNRELLRLLAEARAELAQGSLTAALHKSSEAAAQDPNSIEARTLLEIVQHEIDDRERQHQLYRKLQQVRELLSLNSLDEALALMNALGPDQREAPEALQLLVRIQALITGREREERLQAEIQAARELAEQREFLKAIEVLQPLRAEFPGEPRIETLLSGFEHEAALIEKAQAIEKLQAEVLAFAEAKHFDKALELLASMIRDYAGEAGILRLCDSVLAAKWDWERRQTVEQTVRECDALAEKNHFDEALRAVDQTLAIYPGDAVLDELRRGLAGRRDDFRRAEAIADALGTVELLKSEGRPEDAVATLEALLAASSDERLQRALADARDAVAAKQRAALLLRIDHDVRAYLASHDFDQAFQILDAAPDAVLGDPSLTSLRENALTAKAAWEREETIAATEREAQAFTSEGRIEEAQRVVAACLERLPDAAALIRLDRELREHRERQREEQAVRVTDAQELPSNDLAGALELHETSAQAAQVPEPFTAGHSHQNDAKTAAVQQCLDLIAAGNLAEAGRQLQIALRDFPAEPEFAALQRSLRAEWDRQRRSEAARRAAANARALIDQGQPARAVALLEAAIGQYPDDPLLHEALERARQAPSGQRAGVVESVCRETRVYLEQNDFDRALKTVEVNLKSMSGEQQLIELRETVVAARRDFEQRPPAKPAASETNREDVSPPAAGTMEPHSTPPGAAAPVSVGPKAPPASVTRSSSPRFRKIAIAYAASALALAAAYVGARTLRSQPAATSLEVVTQPAGAAVTVGELSCITPACRLELAGGEYRVVARLPGYTAASELVSIRTGEGARIHLALAPLPLSLAIISNFAAGSVYLDDQAVGELADGQFRLDRVLPGLHRVRVAGPDGEASLSFQAAPAAIPELKTGLHVRDAEAIAIASRGSAVAAICSPCNGAVLMDGRPMTGAAAGSGSHELTARTATGQVRAFFRTAENPAIAVHLNSTASQAGTLVVETNVDGASVWINQRRLARQTEAGRLVLPLEPRDHTVEIRKPGYRVSPSRLVARIRRGDQFRAVFRVDPIPSTVMITGAPESATVAIDGSPAGTIRGGSFSAAVSAGAHTVALMKEGYKTASAQRTFEPGETVRFGSADLPLEPLLPAPQQPPVQQASAPQPARPSAAEMEANEWAAVRSGRSPGAIETFLKTHPNSAHRHEAQQLIAQIEWEALDRKDRSALERFAARHRGTPLGQQAASEIERIEREAEAAATHTAEKQITTDREEIARLLNLYAAAFERKDLNLLKSVWPGLPQAALAQAFRGRGEIRSHLRPLAPAELAGGHATIRCTRVTEQVTQFGRQKPVEEARTVRLRKENGRWVIYAID